MKAHGAAGVPVLSVFGLFVVQHLVLEDAVSARLRCMVGMGMGMGMG